MSSSITDLDLQCSKALFCSDLHCMSGNPCMQLQMILRFVRLLHSECLVIAGDLFDDLHYEINHGRLLFEMQRIGLPKTQRLQIVYAPSRSSHDPIIGDGVLSYGDITIHIARIARIALGGENVVITHGDALIPNGALAHLLNKTAWIVGRKLFLEEKAKRELGVEKDWFVMGHTHIPGIDYERKIGNTGSWKVEWRKGIPYWRTPSKSLIFYDGKSFRMISLK